MKSPDRNVRGENIKPESATQGSEEALVLRAIQRDAAAFALLYKDYVARVYKHVYRQVLNQVEAEDITQEVFIKAWRALQWYKVTGVPFWGWLCVISKNLVTDHWRAKKKGFISLEEAQLGGEIETTDPEAIAEGNVDRGLINNAVARLSGEKKQVITMRFIHGMSHREIAQAMMKTEGGVRVIQHRALADMRRILIKGEHLDRPTQGLDSALATS